MPCLHRALVAHPTPRGDRRRRARALPVPSPPQCGVCVWVRGRIGYSCKASVWALLKSERSTSRHLQPPAAARSHLRTPSRYSTLPSRWDHGLCVVKVHPIRDRRHHPYGDARPGHRQGCDRPHYPRAETQRRLPFQFQRMRGRMHNLRGRDSGPSFPPPVEAASGAAAEEVVVSVPAGRARPEEAGRAEVSTNESAHTRWVAWCKELRLHTARESDQRPLPRGGCPRSSRSPRRHTRQASAGREACVAHRKAAGARR